MFTMLLPDRPTSAVKRGGRDLELCNRVFREIGERSADHLIIVVSPVDQDVATNVQSCPLN